MGNLDIAQTTSTPRVHFDRANNTLLIVGESYPENSFDFYAPVVSWLAAGLRQFTALTLDINIPYMNSSSTKCMFDLIDAMEEAYGHGVKTAIIWRYDSDNSRSCEMAEEFSEEVSFPFEIVTMENEPVTR